MKVRYDAEADVLIFVLKDGFPANAIAYGFGVITYESAGFGVFSTLIQSS